MDDILRTRIAQTIMDSETAGWLVIDRDYNVIYANSYFSKIFAMTSDELIGKYFLSLYNGSVKDDNGLYHGPLIESMHLGREFQVIETCITSPVTNTYTWLVASTFLLKNNREQVEYGVGVYIAIDKFKVLETKFDKLNLDIIKSFCKALGLRDLYSRKHSEHVAALMVEFAEYIAMSPNDVTMAFLAGIVHDIGKIGVPESVLNKQGPLNNEEFELVKKHPAKGAEILDGIEGFEIISNIVLHHHERYDGLGYPIGLSGDDIPYISRMLVICDSYDAMTSARCYRKPYTVSQAVAELKHCAGTQFDPELCNKFIQFIAGEASK